ncbi:MAG: cupin domain-containing protein [Parvibaculum sp.]
MSHPSICLFSAADLKAETGTPPPERILSGSPASKTWNYRESADGKFFSGIWQSTPGKWRIEYDEEEFCHIIEGVSIIIDERTSIATTVKSGDAFTLPAGFKGTWEVVETTRKHYAIYLP